LAVQGVNEADLADFEVADAAMADVAA